LKYSFHDDLTFCYFESEDSIYSISYFLDGYVRKIIDVETNISNFSVTSKTPNGADI
jgi:hypothetical protein